HEPEGLERPGRGEAEVLPGRSRQSARVEHDRALEARSRARRWFQEGRARALHPGHQGVPRPRAEGLSRLGRGEGLAEGDARKDRRAEVMPRTAAWLHKRAENIAAGMLAVMFLAFVVQIVFRYLFSFPIGWSSELTVVCWLWLVLWGSAFVLSEREEIRFDLLYGAVGPRARIAMAI